ncbi:MAG: hypothetical protein AAGI07_14675 [Bacteroidota bacterium]
MQAIKVYFGKITLELLDRRNSYPDKKMLGTGVLLKGIFDPYFEAPLYNGTKPSFLIEEKLGNREWLSELIS